MSRMLELDDGDGTARPLSGDTPSLPGTVFDDDGESEMTAYEHGSPGRPAAGAGAARHANVDRDGHESDPDDEFLGPSISRPRVNGSRRDCGAQTESDADMAVAPAVNSHMAQAGLRARRQSRHDGGEQPGSMATQSSLASLRRDSQRRASLRDNDRRAPIVLSSLAMRSGKVHPAELELDAPKRLVERDNLRAELGRCGLLFHDIRRWWELKRTRRRDPVPVWRGAIKKIEGQFGSGVASFFVFTRWLFLLNCSMALIWLPLVVIPTAIDFNRDATTESFSFVNIFDGKGVVGESWMFYGGYPETIGRYQLGLAYILVLIVVECGCLFFIVRTIAHTASGTDTGGSLVKMDAKMPFCTFVFTSWDHSMNSESAIANLRMGIINAMRETLNEQVHSKEHTSQIKRTTLFAMRFLAWALWLVMMAGSFAIVWFLIQYQDPDGSSFLQTYSAPVVFSFLSSFVPWVMKKLTKLEFYALGSTELKVTICRTFSLRILVIYALLYGLYRKTDLFSTQLPVYSDGDIVDQGDCAGTIIGQEIYKTILLDSVISVVGVTIYLFGWKFTFKTLSELDQAQGTLTLVYRQALIWVGMVFSPMLCVVGLLSNALFFGVYYWAVQRTCRPPRKRWNQGRHNTFFMGALFLTLVLMLVPISIALSTYKPNCGPQAGAEYDNMYDAIWEWRNKQNQGFRRFTEVITAPGFVVPLIMLQGIALYFYGITVRGWKGRREECAREADELRQEKRALLCELNSSLVHKPAPHKPRPVSNTAAKAGWPAEDAV